MTLRGYVSTHVGRRANNEDAFRVNAPVGLFVVADGMGGYEGGEVASQLVVDTIHDFYSRAASEELGLTLETTDATDTADHRMVEERRMELAVRLANREVSSRRVGRLSEMGSTVAVLVVRDGYAVIAHVGDSRVYRMRDGMLEILTRDHSVEAERVAVGGQVTRHMTGARMNNAITRAVGVPRRSRPDIRVEDVTPGDIFLLCTDGLTDLVPDRQIAKTLREMPPYRAVDALVASAYLSGGVDNITALVVEAGR